MTTETKTPDDRIAIGGIELDVPCTTCFGDGRNYGAPCAICNGIGYRVTDVGNVLLQFLYRHYPRREENDD